MNILKLGMLSFILFIGSVQIQSSKKYLPHQMINDETIVTFSYDDKNRFTSIKKENFDYGGNKDIEIDSITYTPDGNGYSITTYTGYIEQSSMDDDKPDYTIIKTVNIVFEEKNEKQITLKLAGSGEEDNRVYFKLAPNGRALSMGINDDSKSTMFFKYDMNGNIARWELSEGNQFIEYYSYMSYCTFHYDDKNGIFKHVDRTPISLIYIIKDIPYLFFLENNITKIQENGRSDFMEEDEYTYNEEGYPATIFSDGTSTQVTYIEAK